MDMDMDMEMDMDTGHDMDIRNTLKKICKITHLNGYCKQYTYTSSSKP
jgi:hypothetical protein